MANAEADGEEATSTETQDGAGWLKYGQALLYAEMIIAILITVFSLYLAFSGQAGFLA